MRVLVAPDKFKGCLTADEVAKQIAAGIDDVVPAAQIDIMPVADGGDGTADVICRALNGTWVTCRANDPLGRIIECRYAFIGNHLPSPGLGRDNGKLAVIEMSEAAGMRRLSPAERDPLRATTFGVGQLILDAARRGAGKIIVGLGGSATNDGGFGMARAFGFRFFDGEGMQVRASVNKLRTLKRIDPPSNVALPPIVGAFDVQNVLLGKEGATHVFGPQKGAAGANLVLLEKCMERLARVASRQVRRADPKQPGAGAAGGLGFGLMVFTGATLRSGFQVVSEIIETEKRLKAADIVITGEGKLDSQTLSGKAPAGIASLARQNGKRVFAVVGRADHHGHGEELFDKVYQLSTGANDEAASIAKASELLRERSREMAKSWTA